MNSTTRKFILWLTAWVLLSVIRWQANMNDFYSLLITTMIMGIVFYYAYKESK